MYVERRRMIDMERQNAYQIGVATMTIKQIQIIELVKVSGQEAAEDMLVCMGWAKTYAQARTLITKAKKAA